MQYQAENQTITIPSGDHLISLRNRKRMDLTSVKSIEQFDQQEFYVRTSQGYTSHQRRRLKNCPS